MRAAEPRLIETVLLGLVQGPAELLPISSSAHVGLLPWVLGWRHAALPGAVRKEVEVALHAGTAAALVWGGRPAVRPAVLAAATAPPAAFGLLLEGVVEARLGTPRSIAFGLLAGSAAMVLADRVPERRSVASAGLVDGAVLGLAQALALIPGVSRSGATRAAARFRGFTRPDAAALSREVAVPVLIGAAVLKATRRPPGRALAAGAATAAASTAAARRLERAADTPLALWAAYRTALAAAIVLVERRRTSTAAGQIGEGASRTS
ncbi:MAG TPA: undecaprenyl-diphosphate phosphatase [Solirubrobacteraceae bacterium]|jgi:undecaprenyl-diphosphatase|nr:undecaprenyl-diphosphate phosphatase [Solirubrobacteraceae bacterium]